MFDDADDGVTTEDIRSEAREGMCEGVSPGRGVTPVSPSHRPGVDGLTPRDCEFRKDSRSFRY